MATLPAFRTGNARCLKGSITPVRGGVEIPYAILEGIHSNGRTLLVTAGVHGSEVSSIEAALRLMRLDPTTLNGSLVLLPIMNMTGFRARSIYIVPEDGKNLNRQFPGSATGTISQRLAFWLSETFHQCDAYLDLHGGDLDQALQPFAICNEDSPASRQLAMASGIASTMAARAFRGASSSCAAAMGIPALTIECGGNGLWCEDNVSFHYNAVLRIMDNLGLLSSSKLARTPALPTTFYQLSVPIADVDGFWYPRTTIAFHVSAGDVLGEIRDAFGQVRRVILAEVAGDIFYQLTSLCVNAGE